MSFHIAPSLKAALGAALLPALMMAAGSAQAHGTAAATTDPRFGLVDAMDAPQSAADSGASWELIPLRWDQLQPASAAGWTPSSAVDAWVSQARSSGREVVGELIGTPAWATDGKPGIGVPRGLYLPVSDSNNLWASFVRQTVGYYGSRGINRWVIWDSPDILPDTLGSKWAGTTEDYYQLVKVAYLVAKGANPGALIHLGAITDKNPAWFARFLDVVVADPTASANNYYFDVASVQIFASPDRVYTLTANPSYLMDQVGIPLKSVWINATNARPAIDPKVYAPDKKFNQFSKISLEQQAAFIIQAFALGFAAQADRIAVYRLADNLDEDGGQAFGLVRTDGDPRPAFDAYKLAVEQFSGFKLARRVDEEAHPLMEYVRLTFPNKVTHVAWALTPNNATLIIPARSTQATLINMSGVQWVVKPEGGIYKLAVGGADCNDPNTVGGCLVGGDPWILVEDGVQNPLTEAAPKSKVELGGALPTPPPTPTQTATPLPPTPTPAATTAAPTQAATLALALTATPETAAPASASQPPASVAPQPTQVAAVIPPTTIPTATPSAEELAQAVSPRGFPAALPYLLMGLGALVIGGGLWFFLSGHKPAPVELPPDELQTVEPPYAQPEEVETVEEPKPRKRRGRRKKSAPADEPPPEMPAFDEPASGEPVSGEPSPDEPAPGEQGDEGQ